MAKVRLEQRQPTAVDKLANCCIFPQHNRPARLVRSLKPRRNFKGSASNGSVKLEGMKHWHAIVSWHYLGLTKFLRARSAVPHFHGCDNGYRYLRSRPWVLLCNEHPWLPTPTVLHHPPATRQGARDGASGHWMASIARQHHGGVCSWAWRLRLRCPSAQLARSLAVRPRQPPASAAGRHVARMDRCRWAGSTIRNDRLGERLSPLPVDGWAWPASAAAAAIWPARISHFPNLCGVFL